MAEEAASEFAQGDMQEAWRLQHHALRQPLNALGLFCEALKMQPLSASQQPLVAGIADAAVAIEHLVDEHFAGLRGLAAASAEPLSAAPVLASRPTGLSPAAPGPATDDSRPAACRILVVDDDHAARTGLVLLLEAWGASVQAFADIDALARWLEGPGVAAPDLLMLDYHLPRPGDGLMALRLVRQAWPVRPVHALLITGDERAANALSDGSLECMIKPVTPEPLLAAIRRQVGAQFGT
ncbi:MAG: response regulator [Betaproteobacteria bacterium]|jgi:CheY-like chemotaxis protein